MVPEPVNLTSFFNDDSSKIGVLNHPKTKMNGIKSVKLTDKLTLLKNNIETFS
jgi:hypothetical protein